VRRLGSEQLTPARARHWPWCRIAARHRRVARAAAAFSPSRSRRRAGDPPTPQLRRRGRRPSSASREPRCLAPSTSRGRLRQPATGRPRIAREIGCARLAGARVFVSVGFPVFNNRRVLLLCLEEKRYSAAALRGWQCPLFRFLDQRSPDRASLVIFPPEDGAPLREVLRLRSRGELVRGARTVIDVKKIDTFGAMVTVTSAGTCIAVFG